MEVHDSSKLCCGSTKRYSLVLGLDRALILHVIVEFQPIFHRQEAIFYERLAENLQPRESKGMRTHRPHHVQHVLQWDLAVAAAVDGCGR